MARSAKLKIRSLLKVFDLRLGLQESAGLEEFDFAKRIYVATGGQVGLVSKLLVAAVRRSIEQDRPYDLNLLGEVHASFRKKADRDADMEIDFDRDVLKDPVKPKSLPRSENPFFCSPSALRGLWKAQREVMVESEYEQRGRRKVNGARRKKLEAV